MMLTVSSLAGNPRYIRHYADDSFTVGDKTYQHAIVLCNNGRISPWSVSHIDQFNETEMQALLDTTPELVIIGTGKNIHTLPQKLMSLPLSRGIGLELMETGAACRSYNLLLEDGRTVLTALLPANTV